jgi:hypothetical protein
MKKALFLQYIPSKVIKDKEVYIVIMNTSLSFLYLKDSVLCEYNIN